MDDAARLETLYCPPLDVALFTAIISDFDLTTAQGQKDAKATLDPLRESAALEEAAGFEPSGVSSDSQLDQSLLSSDGVTDSTSISNGMSSLNVEDHIEPEQDLDQLDEDTKLLLLHDVFGEQVSSDEIKLSLRKCNGSWSTAMDDLLTQVYCIEAEDSDGGKLIPKGIDGFSGERTSRPQKRKKKRQRISTSADSTASDTSDVSVGSQTSNKWQTVQGDIDFITSHIQVPAKDVRIKYNQNGASVPQTINAFLKEEMQKHDVEDDDETRRNAQELGRDFPAITPTYLLALIRITAPSTAAAHELAKALIRREYRPTKLVPQYKRTLDDNSIEGSTWQSVSHKGSTTHSYSHLSAGSYAAARAQAFAQASAAHRKSKSDRLYGGAAAYYAQVARDINGLTTSANSTAMDALAASQSSASQVDLHGIDVVNGVRIARQRVETWWSSLGESRINGRRGAADRNSGFAIVVGRGTHSEGGKSKLGPAVMKMLKNEGWKVNNDGAVISVMGKMR